MESQIDNREKNSGATTRRRPWWEDEATPETTPVSAPEPPKTETQTEPAQTQPIEPKPPKEPKRRKRKRLVEVNGEIRKINYFQKRAVAVKIPEFLLKSLDDCHRRLGIKKSKSQLITGYLIDYVKYLRKKIAKDKPEGVAYAEERSPLE